MHTKKPTVIFLLFLRLICVFTDEDNLKEEYADLEVEYAKLELKDTNWTYYIELVNHTDYNEDYDTNAIADAEDTDYSNEDTARCNGRRTHYGMDEIDNSPALRIVNGRPAKVNEIQYQISFKRKLNWKTYYSFCGGTLITRKRIISAAHCFVKTKGFDFCSKGRISKSDLKHYWAVAGNLRTQDSRPSSLGPSSSYSSSDKGQWKRLSSVRYPPTYKFPKDDISVVTMVSPMRFNDAVKPIPYARKAFPIEGKECVASGYGRLSIYRQETPRYLMVAKLKIWTKSECSRWHRKNMNKFICTDHSQSDVAEGDSGGPLVCEDGGKAYLVGVVCGRTSYGRRRRGRPGRRWYLVQRRTHGSRHSQHSSYFTRVTAFRQFLAKRGPRTGGGPGLTWLCLFILYFIDIS